MIVIHLSGAFRETLGAREEYTVRFATRTSRTPTTKRIREVFLSPDSIQRELLEVDQKERISMSELSNESSEGNQNAWSWPQPNTHYERSRLLSPAAQHMSFDNARLSQRLMFKTSVNIIDHMRSLDP